MEKSGSSFALRSQSWMASVVPAAVVKQIAEIIRRAGVARIGAHGGFENGNLLQPRRKTIVRRLRGGALVIIQRGFLRRQIFRAASRACKKPAALRPNFDPASRRRPARCHFKQVNGFGIKSGAGKIMGNVQSRLRIAGIFSGRPPIRCARPPVERIERQAFRAKTFQLHRARSNFRSTTTFKLRGAEVVGVKTQRAVQMLQRRCPNSAARQSISASA